MLVGERMTHPVITVRTNVPIMDAYELMKKEKIRRLPVVDKKGSLVGMLSEREILHASPSQATSLSMWELNYLMSKVTVDEIMTSDVITVDVETPLEEAARIMAENKIGGLPVMRDGKLAGIVTETDLFKVFLELFGAHEPGIRITVLVPNVPGELSKLTAAIFKAGGNILALGTSRGEDTSTAEITLKVEGVTETNLREAVKSHVQKIIDVRSMKAM
jgi:acetoin utilization protein AcuB